MAKSLRATMPDGSKWDVPLGIIAAICMSRLNDAALEDVIADDDLMIDWAENNMHWSDVIAWARQTTRPRGVDYEDGWANGEKEIVDSAS